MHKKLTEHGKFCVQNNQLPSKTPIELKNNPTNQLLKSPWNNKKSQICNIKFRNIIQIHNNVLWDWQYYATYSHIQTGYEQYST